LTQTGDEQFPDTSNIRLDSSHCKDSSRPCQELLSQPAKKAGFATLHYNLEEGPSLILWRKDGSNQDFQDVSLTNLWLSSWPKPPETYNGNWLIVLGEDRIGMIILFYQVSNGDVIYPEKVFS